MKDTIDYHYVQYLKGRLEGKKDVIKVRKHHTDTYELEHYAYGNIGWWPFEWGVDFKDIAHILSLDDERQPIGVMPTGSTVGDSSKALRTDEGVNEQFTVKGVE